jgi:4-amino-4-deoxy-L-arabinose transferase-like glycosyltransferase
VTTDRPKHLNRYIVAILLLAVTFRIYAVLSHPTTPSGDAADYHRLATGLVHGLGYINSAGRATAWRPPAYPLFLAATYKILGVNVLRVTIVQALLGAVTVLLLIALASLLLDWRTALVAGLVAAVYPAFIWLPCVLLSENLSIFLLLLTLIAIVLYLRTSRITWILVFGAICGLSSLVRSTNLSLPIAVVLGVVIIRWRSRSVNWNQLVEPILIMTLAFVLTLTPWAIRNYRVFHQLIPVATQDGLTLYGSYWPPQRNGKLIWGTLPGTEDPAIVAATTIGDEASASRFLRQLTQQRLREHPGFFLG